MSGRLVYAAVLTLLAGIFSGGEALVRSGYGRWYHRQTTLEACTGSDPCCLGNVWQPCQNKPDSSWSSWSHCISSAACGYGTTTRTRHLCCPLPTDEGVDCDRKCGQLEDDVFQTQNCSVFCCPSGACFPTNLCYPGTCDLDSDCTTCSCAPGFSGKNCTDVARAPDYVQCEVDIWANESPEEGHLLLSCMDKQVTSDILYTRIPPQSVKVAWEEQFPGPDMTQYPLPTEPFPYITGFQVGLTQVDLNITVIAATVSDPEPQACENAPSPSNPSNELVNCSRSMDLGSGWQHAESLNIGFASEVSGFVNVQDYNCDDQRDCMGCTFTYPPTTSENVISVVHDVLKPENAGCPTCEALLLDSAIYTKSATVNVSWEGWVDLPAGISRYNLAAYHLTGSPLSDGGHPPVAEVSVGTADDTASLTLQYSGMYSLVLAVADTCQPISNVQLARRFVLYDAVSNVYTLTFFPIIVTSAQPETSFTWLTTTSTGSDGNGVSLTWGNHFENRVQMDNNWLNAIGDHSAPIAPMYDLLTGQPPETRSATRVVNARGIVRWQYTWVVNPPGPEALEHPGNWLHTDIFDFTPTESTMAIARQNGDAVAFVVRGYDVIENFANSYVLSYVDSSPPLIDNMVLMKDGIPVEYINSTMDIFDLSLYFHAYDHHSGLSELHWELRSRHDPLQLHGEGYLPVKRHTNGNGPCVYPRCYCTRENWGSECYYNDYELTPDSEELHIPPGEYDYYYIIRATNSALEAHVAEHHIHVGET